MMNPEIITSTEIPRRPHTIEELLVEYEKNKSERKPLEVHFLEFLDLAPNQTVGAVSGKITLESQESIAAQIDCYNPSKTFSLEGRNVAAVRVEPRSSEKDSRVKFFEIEGSRCQPIEDAPVLEGYQDPFYEGEIQGKKILGAVKILEKEGELLYKTEFFKFRERLSEIEKFAEGPTRMKDIRLVELPSGKIGIFIRPQGGIYGRGQIGYLEIERLDELEENLKHFEQRTKIFDSLFAPGEWGGINDIQVLKNGRLGLIGHIARFAQENGEETGIKEYYAISALFDPSSREIADLKIMMTQRDLEEALHAKVESKTPNQASILYPGGAERQENGTIKCYAGVGDTQAIEFSEPDPFLDYEG